jgi:Mg-chelatase subunit ChlD
MGLYPRELTRRVFERVVGAMSGLSEIKVELDDNQCPHFSPEEKKIVTSYVIPYADTDKESFDFGRAIMVHEASHLLFAPDVPSIKKKLQKLVKDFNKEAKSKLPETYGQRIFQTWLNIFLDSNNEYRVSKLFPHLGVELKRNTEKLYEKRKKGLATDNPYMQTLMRIDKVATLHPIYPPNYGFSKFIDEVVKEYHDKKLYEAKSSEILDFTLKVTKKFAKLCDADDLDEIKEMIESLQKELAGMIREGGHTDTEIKEIEQKISDLNGKLKTLEYSDKLDKKRYRESITGETTQSDYSEFTLEELKDMLKRGEEEKMRAGLRENSAWGNSNIDDLGIEEVDPRQYYAGKSSSDEEYNDAHAYSTGKAIHRQLLNRIKLAKDQESKHLSGDLDLEEIRRQVGEYGRVISERVFERPEKFTRLGEWAIEVLVDCSGSMSGHKMSQAKQCFATLAYALDGLPNVRYSLIGFTEFSKSTEFVVKSFSENRLLKDKLRLLRSESGNADGLHILNAITRMKMYPHLKKVLFVISDGQPAFNYKGKDGITATKEAVVEAEKHGIKVVGIGIPGATAESLKEIYPVNYLFDNNTGTLADDIANLVISSLGDKHAAKLVKNKWDVM